MESLPPQQNGSPAAAPTRRSEIGEESRQRILDAAERLFIEYGVTATSFARIEREAGISRGSIPWHFKNKRGLLLAILDRAMVTTSADFSDLEGRSGVQEAFNRIRTHLHKPQTVLLAALLSESVHVDSDTHDRYHAFHASGRSGFADLVRRSEDTPQPGGIDEDTLATIIYGAVIGVSIQHQVAPELVDLDKTIDALAHLVGTLVSPNEDNSAQ